MRASQEIIAAWEKASGAFGFDPITGDSEAQKLLHNPEHERGAITDNIAGLERVKAQCPDFFLAYDYDWAFDAKVYRRAIEANLQTRAIQLLAMLHRNPNTPRAFDYGGMVVRYTFEAGTDPCTPFHAPYRNLHFIAVPFSFLEFVLLLIRAFVETMAEPKPGWDALATGAAIDKADVSPCLRQAIVRSMTTAAFHPGFDGESPVDVVKRKSTWFAAAKETSNVDENIEIALTYSLTDFALAHELGHSLLGHQGVAREPDLRLNKEQDADAMGFALYNSSWGWRDEILDPCPLNQGPRILLGPLMFHLFIKWQLALRQGLAYRSLTIMTRTDDVRVDQLNQEADESAARSAMAFKQIGMYEAQIRERGAKFTQDDSRVYGALARAGGEFALHIFNAVRLVPDDDFAIAYAAGEVGF